MQSCEEIAGSFFVARGDAPEVFDDVEETFDQVAFAVEREVAITLDLAIRFWRDDNLDLAGFKARNEAVRIIALAGEQGRRLYLGGQNFRLLDVMDIAAGQAEHQRIAKCVNHGVDFGRETTPGAAYGLIETPFF